MIPRAQIIILRRKPCLARLHSLALEDLVAYGTLACLVEQERSFIDDLFNLPGFGLLSCFFLFLGKYIQILHLTESE